MAEQLPSSAARKSEVIIITGFLGAGKTTLLKKILSWESDLSETVVLVNEFGDVGIDGSLLKNAGSDVVELTGGCICCTMKADLVQTLKKIWQEFNPKQIFIESTGVADPFMITAVFDDAELRDQMQISKVITVLDIELWEARDYFGPVFFNQLKQADLILLNKIDIVNENKVSQFLKEIHETLPRSQVVPTIHCNVAPDIVLTGSTRIRELSNFAELDHHHHDHELDGENRNGNADAEFPYTSFSFRSRDALDEACFKRFTANLPWELFRMKGPVRLPDRTVLVNYVAGKNEWSWWDGQDETCLVFVGWNVSGEETIEKLKNCIIDKEDE
ncbi:MAG: GTP-binding protein [Deltaproteobacteria bacterium]|jgi:G3E family GTPase|nr:GTP-binding protein [Deltaproteobacteria bacterium]